MAEILLKKIYVTTTNTIKFQWENIPLKSEELNSLTFTLLTTMSWLNKPVNMNYTQLKDFFAEPMTAFSNKLKLSLLSKWFGRVNESKHVDAKIEGTLSNFTLILLSPKLGKPEEPVTKKTKFSNIWISAVCKYCFK